VTDELRFDVIVEDHGQRLVVNGELDMATVPALEAAFEERVASGPAADHLAALPVVLDLSRCSFLDSSGVRSVVTLAQRTEAAGRRFSVVSPPGSGSRFTLDLLGVGSMISVLDSLGDLPVDGGAAETA
jgi:anti-anti-sigma factor